MPLQHDTDRWYSETQSKPSSWVIRTTVSYLLCSCSLSMSCSRISHCCGAVERRHYRKSILDISPFYTTLSKLSAGLLRQKDHSPSIKAVWSKKPKCVFLHQLCANAALCVTLWVFERVAGSSWVSLMHIVSCVTLTRHRPCSFTEQSEQQ